YSVHQEFSLKPQSLLGVFIPGLAVNSEPYIGSVALALAILGVVLTWRDSRVRWLMVIGWCGLLYALGFNSGVPGILYSLVPLVEKACVPDAGTLIFGLGAAPLAAFGLDGLSQPESSVWLSRTTKILVGLAAILALTGMIFALTPLKTIV